MKIYKATYGDSVLIKEEYHDKKVIIKAFDADGNILIQEYKYKKNSKKADDLNIFYCRIDNVIKEWEDITAEIVDNIITDIAAKNCEVEYDNVTLLYALRGANIKGAVKLSNGAILVEGKHESLAFWKTEDNTVLMAWLGRKYPIEKYQYTDITKQLNESLHSAN